MYKTIYEKWKIRNFPFIFGDLIILATFLNNLKLYLNRQFSIPLLNSNSITITSETQITITITKPTEWIRRYSLVEPCVKVRIGSPLNSIHPYCLIRPNCLCGLSDGIYG